MKTLNSAQEARIDVRRTIRTLTESLVRDKSHMTKQAFMPSSELFSPLNSLISRGSMTTLGLRSPVSRSGAVSPQPPRPAFDAEVLRTYMKKLLPATLSHAVWSSIERDQVKAWMKEIGERVKERMVQIQSNGLYVE